MNLVAEAASEPFFVAHDAADFPARLRGAKPQPLGLWVRGRLPRAEQSLIAIVGARAASRKACAAVSALASDLARDGIGIVSGGALGIDAAAHEGALAAGGATFAVLGCGIDVVYPDRHARLFQAIVTEGGLLSEYGPGVAPKAWQFPVRNRLVAALAEAVVVAECRPGSGALITADLARRLGRTLLAVPGSAGTDALIAGGAAFPVDSALAVRAALSGPGAPGPRAARAVPGPFAGLMLTLAGGPATAPELALKLGVSLAEVLGVLSEAELDGFVRRLPGGRFEVSRGS